VNRLLRWAVLLTFSASAVAFTACEADVKEDCYTAGCVDPALETDPVGAGGGGTGTGTAAGGAGGGGPFACSLDPSCVIDMPGPATGIIPCDVDKVLTDKCRRCHQDPPLNQAPFPLVSYANTQVLYGTRSTFAAMHSAITTDFMPLTPPDLTPAEKEIMLTWLCACAQSAPPGTTCP